MVDVSKNPDEMESVLTFINLIKQLPEKASESARLLTIGFMNGLDAAQSMGEGNRETKER